VRRVLVQADTTRDLIARDLEKVEHLKSACEFESDDVVAVGHRATPHSCCVSSSVGIGGIISKSFMTRRYLLSSINND
jgi:hypothetical protein